MGVTTIVWGIAEMFPVGLINLFGGGEELLSIGVSALRINFIIAPLLGFVMIATTFFQSIGKPNASSFITLIRQVVALVPLIYIFPIFCGIVGVFYAQPISDLIATTLSIVLIVAAFKKMPNAKVECGINSTIVARE